MVRGGTTDSVFSGIQADQTHGAQLATRPGADWTGFHLVDAGKYSADTRGVRLLEHFQRRRIYTLGARLHLFLFVFCFF
jgi:hypothetical protein